MGTRIEGRGYIDELEILRDPSSRAYAIRVLREYRQVAQRIDQRVQLPAWQALARARQGGD